MTKERPLTLESSGPATGQDNVKKNRISRFFSRSSSTKSSNSKESMPNSTVRSSDYEPPSVLTTASAPSPGTPLHSRTPSPRKWYNRIKHRASDGGLRRYRGFSTSISSLFLDETIVCPSMAWCGVLSSSRTEHLLHVRNQRRRSTNNEFRSPSRILSNWLIVTIIGIIVSYFIWGFGERSGQDNYYGYYHYRTLKENAPKLYVPGVMRFADYRKRFWIPFEIVLNDILLQGGDDGPTRKLAYSVWNDQDLASNVRIIFCIVFLIILGIFGRRRRMKTRFAVLKARSQDDKVYYGGQPRKNLRKEDKYEGACSHTLCGCYPIDQSRDHGDDGEQLDLMNAGYAKVSSCFCGMICRMWAQCCSICALAQEAREVRLLLPPKAQRMDYITHQPFEEYFEDIYLLRHTWKGKSKTSGAWRSHIGALSSLSRYLLITFISVTAVIIVVEQINPRAIFSWADACVLIMTFVQSFLVLGVVHGAFHKSDLSLDAVIKFFATGFLIATPMAFMFEAIIMNAFMIVYYGFASIVAVLAGQGLSDWIEGNFIWFLCAIDVFQAFFVAACAEEICKYYTFRCVEHPDLIFLTGLDRVSQGTNAKLGGEQAYPFSSNNASSVDARTGSFESIFSSKPSHRGAGGGKRFLKKSAYRDMDIVDEPDVRSVRQRAAAVTTAMISCAVGLACAENFIYVFFLGGSNAQEEITMLLFRSVFPVHALCAGMQSIGVIEKFLEEKEDSNRIGVGRIILPAVLLHGTFDSILMMINSYVDVVLNDNGGVGYGEMLNIVAAASVVGVMLFACLWYYFQNRRQKARLKVMEDKLFVSVNGDANSMTPNQRRREEQAIELL